MATKKRMQQMLAKATRYAWKPGLGYGAETAQMVGIVLEQMQMTNTPITPENLLNMARDPDNPLHPLFEWDNDVAAEKYRLHQARQIVSHIVFKEQVGEQEVERKMYFSLTHAVREEEPERQYVSVRKVEQDEHLRNQVEEQAMRELRSFADKYRHFNFSRIGSIITLIESMGK